MKGIVFTEFIEMVEDKFSIQVADRLLDECDLPSGGIYTAVGTYDHHEIVSMVVKLSEISGIPVPGLINAFGQYLFPRFHALYPNFFEGVNNAFDFLESIDSVIHIEVLKLYPDAELPKFDSYRPNSETLVMTYYSDRHMGDLAEGLIQACVNHYGEPYEVHRENLQEPGQPVRFTIRKPQ